jgi:hypothetical protein
MEFRVNIANDRVPQWLVERIHNCANQERHPHYEASLSGPHNEFLHCHFPNRLEYMVKPIPRLRTIGGPNQRTSKDSYNQPVLTQERDANPDFLVCKATKNLNQDRAFLIWELKRNSADSAKSSVQVSRYEAWLRKYQEFMYQETGSYPMLWMALVEGDMVTVDQFLVGDMNQPDILFTTVFPVLSMDMDNLFNQMLQEIP